MAHSPATPARSGRSPLAAAALLAAALTCASPANADVTVTSMVMGGEHACALTPAGGVKCWGNNQFGQLGDGTTLRKALPATVIGLASGVAAIAGGGNTVCALTTGGGVKCWGQNQFTGALGNGSFDDGSSTPVDVTGLGSGVVAIAGSGSQFCATLAGGGLKCWGDNRGGGLGDGTSNNVRNVPVDVTVALGGPVTALAVGSHTCALVSGGVKCWGGIDPYGTNYGVLGNGTTVGSLTPVTPTGLGSGVVAIASGGLNSCALTNTGALKCWGSNRWGQLGDGADIGDTSTWVRTTPVDVVGLSSGVAQVAMGGNHTCARMGTGTVKCWGTDRFYGALGDGPWTASNDWSPVPVDVVGLPGAVTALYSGFRGNCALVAGGVPRCWGSNDFGQLGLGASRGPIHSPHYGIPDYQVSAGISHTLMVTPNGEVWAWGDNTAGKLGNGTTAASTVPVRVTGLTDIVAVAAGMAHSLALSRDGRVWAWGLNADGQLGIGAASPSTCAIPFDSSRPCARTPVEVTAITDVVEIGAGWRHSLALKQDRTVWDWGNQNQGLVNTGIDTPTQKTTIAFIERISAGYMHSVAIGGSGAQVYAWGRGDHGELGPSTAVSTTTPQQVSGAAGASDIHAGGGYTLSRHQAGTVYAWGMNAYGTLGDPAVPTDAFNDGWRASPDGVIGMSDVLEVRAGFGFAIARKSDGTFWSWGLNNHGQLGTGAAPDLCGSSGNRPCARTAANVAAHDGALRLDAGGAHAFTGRPGGSIVLFGNNYVGQLAKNGSGYGTFFNQSAYDPDGTLFPAGTFGSGGSVGSGSGGGGLTVDSVDNGVAFAAQLVGSGSAVAALTLSNLGENAMGITGIGASGDFGSSTDCPGSLGSGVSCTINVQFVPAGVGERYGALTITTDSPDAPSIGVALSGFGVSAPTAPQSVGAVAGNGQATVSFSPPASNGGSAITGYTVTSNPGNVTQGGTASPIVVTTLANGTAYTFTVKATNAYGTSVASAPSNSVTPTAPVLLTVSLAGAGGGTVSGTGIACPGDCTESFPVGTNVLLGAAATGGSVFAGWSGGGCSGTGSCQVTMNAPVTVTATFSPAPSAPRHSDANGDGRSDVLWRDTTGGLAYQWQMNGLAISGQGYMPPVPPNWAIAGLGDVNADGRVDVLWRDSGGLNYLWMMNDLTIANQGYLPSVPNTWAVVGLGDADGDGRADVFWRNPAAGLNYLWTMNGLTIANQGYLPSVAGTDWEAVAVADFTGDAKADVLWRNKANGQNYLWAMNGLAVSNQGYLPTVTPTDWEAVGAPDANGDGKADVLWRNKATGDNYLWLMNGFSIAGQGYLPPVADANWKVVGYGDYNGDGRGDVLWRNASAGTNYLWILNGMSVTSQGYLPSVSGANWQPVKR